MIKLKKCFLLVLSVFSISCAGKPDLSYLDACSNPDALKAIQYYVKHDVADSEGLMIAAEQNSNEKIVEELLKSKIIDLEEKNEALFKSLNNNNLEVCKIIIASGADINSQNEEGVTPLILAIEKENIDLVNLLITAGADVEAKNDDGDTTLLMAIKKSLPKDFIHTLISAGANMDAVYDFYGITMLPIPGKNFEMMATEVTQKTYKEIMGKNPSWNSGDNFPVETVNWYDAVKFCNILSRKFGFTPVYIMDEEESDGNVKKLRNGGYLVDLSPHHKPVSQDTSANGFRLPTSGEWEYAAKGGTSYTYAGSNNVDDVAWHLDNSGKKTHPVARKKPNNYGLYDMSGNVWEWCWTASSDWGRNLDPDNGKNRVVRGGGCDRRYGPCAVNYSEGRSAVFGDYYVGFRIVRNIE